MNLDIVDFNNYKVAIQIQQEIFPQEDGRLNILASLDRNLFMKLSGLYYPDDNVKYYIASIENTPIGITGLYYENDKQVWLAWFGILPNHRGKGYGKILLEETMHLAKKRGFRELRLYTDKVDNSEAIKLYEKLGFVGEKYLAETLPYDCWIYSKNLYGENTELWNNKNLELSYQSDLEHIDIIRIQDIINLYEKYHN